LARADNFLRDIDKEIESDDNYPLSRLPIAYGLAQHVHGLKAMITIVIGRRSRDSPWKIAVQMEKFDEPIFELRCGEHLRVLPSPFAG